MQVLDRENKEIILLGGTNCDILTNYSDCDSLDGVLPTHSTCILELYGLSGFQQLIKKGNQGDLGIYYLNWSHCHN